MHPIFYPSVPWIWHMILWLRSIANPPNWPVTLFLGSLIFIFPELGPLKLEGKLSLKYSGPVVPILIGCCIYFEK